MQLPQFLDLPPCTPEVADALLLPLPYEGTVTYGRGTAAGPAAIWQASKHVELWDEELDFDLEPIQIYSASPLTFQQSELPEEYLIRVFRQASELNRYKGLVVGVGGEHSLTPPLVAAAAQNSDDLSHLTVIQLDAHADLRDVYDGTPYSHACAMRRLVEKGARVIAIGIRSAERAEHRFGCDSGRVRTYFAQQLASDEKIEKDLRDILVQIKGDVYLTIDVDGFEVTLCPNTGTPQPGGLGWWQTLRYLRAMLYENRAAKLVGCDVVETVPIAGSQVNEITSARLIAKILAYHLKP